MFLPVHIIFRAKAARYQWEVIQIILSNIHGDFETVCVKLLKIEMSTLTLWALQAKVLLDGN